MFSLLVGLVAADLLISLFHGGTIQIVRAFQHGVLAELLLQPQHDFLELLFLFQLGRVCEQINLEDALVIDHTVGCNGDPSHGQRLISNLVEQGDGRLDELTSEVGRIVQPSEQCGRNGRCVLGRGRSRYRSSPGRSQHPV